jgi:membrane-bound lytic murein transglycosylase A
MSRRWGAFLLLMALGGCATTQAPGVGREVYARPPAPPTVGLPPSALPALAVADLPGWAEEDHLAALRAFQATCSAAQEPQGRRACDQARRMGPSDERDAKRFFETRFRVEPVSESGLLTAYFAPEYEAKAEPDEIFCAPVLARPPELERGPDGRFKPWLSRAEIETAGGQALAFMRPEDLFFMQIQGSGYLNFPDGRRMHAAYAGDNGLPFTGIARPLIDRGLMKPNETSGEGIRAWLADHRGSEAQAITDLNARYVFFALSPDDRGQPLGAAGLALPAGRAAAVDTRLHGFGELLWLDAEGGSLKGAAHDYRRLVVSLDAGGAIKGPARVDLYMGRGPAAGAEAGRVKHSLKLYRLTPVD